MTEGTKFEGGSLERASQKFVSHFIELKKNEVQLRAEVDALKDFWQGEAAQTYDEAVERWEAAATRTDEELVDVGEKLNLAGSMYAAREAENKSRVQRAAYNF